jgi:hypothetical protein
MLSAYAAINRRVGRQATPNEFHLLDGGEDSMVILIDSSGKNYINV